MKVTNYGRDFGFSTANVFYSPDTGIVGGSEVEPNNADNIDVDSDDSDDVETDDDDDDDDDDENENAEGESVAETDTKPKRGRKKSDLPNYPVPDGGLTEAPTDWSPTKYRMLGKTAFKDEAVYFVWKGETLITKGEKLRNKGQRLLDMGTPEQRAALLKYEKIKKDLADMLAFAEKNDIDFDAQLAELNADDE